MLSQNPLPLSILCAVSVTAARQGATTPTFNQGMIFDNEGIIPSVGPNSRVQAFGSLAAVLAAGFSPTGNIAQGATLYFSATPTPSVLWVGCQDPTAILTGAIDVAGTDYAVGDLVTVTQAGASLGVYRITTAPGGIPSAITQVSQGTGYSIASALPTTTTGSGSGLTISITAIGETPLQALTAIRLAQPAWYLGSCLTPGITDADIQAMANFAQAAQPAMQLVYSTAEASALNGSIPNIFTTLSDLDFSRAHGAYATTQGGAFPNNVLIAAAIQGCAMGLNTGQPNSAFTLMAKSLPGIAVEPLTQNQVNTFAGTPGLGLGNDGNVYVNYANTYSFYQQGVNANGTWFDQVLGLDMLAADAQLSVIAVLATLPSIPQDNAGQSLVLNAANGACARSAQRGFLAGGTWTGQTVLNVSAGTSLPLGYLAQSASFSTQSPADKALRKGMPIFITVILAGSQQSFTIGISVQE